MKPDPVQLDYGTDPGKHRWGWWIAGLAVALAPAVLYYSLQDLHTQWRAGRQVAAMYRAALLSAPPVDTLVYGEQEDRGSVHLWGRGDIARRDGLSAGWRSREGMMLLVFGVPQWPSGTVSLYIGEAATEAGDTRLVLVHLDDARLLLPGRLQMLTPVRMDTTVLDGFDWRGNPKTPPVTGTVQIGVWPDPRERRTRFYFGAADPADASRFSIRYEVGNDEGGFEEGFIDGKLEDDLTVTLTLRDGPLRE